jgi:hypothetical protein
LKKALKKGFKVSIDGITVSLDYKHVRLTFERVINAMDGCMTGVTMKPLTINNIIRLANASISNERTHDINYLHKLLGNRKNSSIRFKYMDSSLL